MTLTNSEHSFGRGHFVGDIWRDIDEYDAMDPRDRARLLGWVAGCPVVEELTDPETGRGSDEMADRYAEVSLWFTIITESVWEHNPKLADAFYAPIQRLDDDVVGKYESTSIPSNHFEQMAPIGTLAGYAMPRIFIEQINGSGGHPNNELNAVQGRVVAGMRAVERAAESESPLEFTARLAEELYNYHSANPYKMLQHLLAPGWLEEHGAEWMVQDMKQALITYAPHLTKAYEGISDIRSSMDIL